MFLHYAASSINSIVLEKTGPENNGQGRGYQIHIM